MCSLHLSSLLHTAVSDRRAIQLMEAEPESESRRRVRARRNAARDGKLRQKARAGEYADRPNVCSDPSPLQRGADEVPAFEAVRERLPFWRRHGTTTVVDLLTVGLALTFAHSPPESLFVPAFDHAPAEFNFLSDTVAQLVTQGYAAPSMTQPRGCFPLFAVEKDGSTPFRAVYDCSVLNAFLDCPLFSYETIDVTLGYARPGDYFISTDITQAFWTIPVAPSAYEWLGFEWPPSSGQFYTWQCCPFGLKTSCYAWNSVFKTFVVSIRTLGTRVTFFGDDLLALGTEAELVILAPDLRRRLSEAGLRFNLKKSVWIPTQVITYIGYTIDSFRKTLGIKQSRLDKTRRRLAEMVTEQTWSRRDLARVAGGIMSMAIVLGHLAFVRLKRIWPTVADEMFRWDQRFPVGPLLRGVFVWWSDFFRNPPSRPLWQPRRLPDVVAASDASAGGAGVVHSEPRQLQPSAAARSFTRQEREMSSTLREIVAVLFGLRTFGVQYTGLTVVFRVDNQGVYFIVRYGSRISELQTHSEAIADIAYERCISLRIEWIPRIQNKEADLASRLYEFDIDDWTISDSAFGKICRANGSSPSADLFADNRNKRAETYYSRWHDVGTAGIDATTIEEFTQAGQGTLYACPPTQIALRFINRLPIHQNVLLVIPTWRSSPWYPLIMDGGYPRSGFRLLRTLNGRDFRAGPVGRAAHVLSHRTSFFVLRCDRALT